MARPRDIRERVVRAATRVFAERGVVTGTRRDVARLANVPMRTVSVVARRRVDLLRLVVEQLPASPVAVHISDQAKQASEPALQVLLRAVRDISDDPATGWDALELQALVTAPFDARIREVEARRLELRWRAATQVVHQLRGEGTPDHAVTDEAAALHLMSLGLGIAMLSPLSDRLREPHAWAPLAARVLDTVATDDSASPGDAPVTWRARTSTSTKASATSRVLRALALIDVEVSSLSTAPLGEGRQLLDMILRAPAAVERDTIIDVIATSGSDVIVARGYVDDRDDVAARVLRLCADLVAHPEDAPAAAATLVLADSWAVTDPASGDDASALVLRLQWTFDRHVVLRRVRAPFTSTERRRASALLDVVAALSESRGSGDDFGWHERTRDGEEILIRLGRPQDAAAVAAMHERCSQQSRYFRYFAPMSAWREENLNRISGGHRGAALVVTSVPGAVVALGNLFPIEPGVAEVGEIAVIVEDEWHHRGIGRLVIDHLIEVARRQGFDTLVAYVLAGNRSMLALLEGSGLAWERSVDLDLGQGVLQMRADLR